MVGRIVAMVVVGLLVAGRAQAQMGAGAERKALQKYAPAPLSAPMRARNADPTLMRVHVWADPDFQLGGVSWKSRVKQLFTSVNAFTVPVFGARFEVVRMSTWHRQSRSSQLEPLLGELEKHDPGEGVDWVIGFVAPLPIVTASIHNIGMARGLGKHFVLRGMSSLDEAADLRRAFPVLAKFSPEDLEKLYALRKSHKELVVFLHEWAHTLGAIHVDARDHVMSPSYSYKSSVLAPVDTTLLDIALQDKLGARGAGQVGWPGLKKFLAETNDRNWYPGERESLLSVLGQSGAVPTEVQDTNRSTITFATEEAANTYNRALAHLREDRAEAAWEALRPLVSGKSPHPGALRLACRLGYLAAAGPVVEQPCKDAMTKAADDTPEPYIDVAWALTEKNAPRQEVLKLAEEATRRLSRNKDPDPESRVLLAHVYLRLGAISFAEEALGAGSERSPTVEQSRDLVRRRRRFLGLPAKQAPPGIPPQSEPDYVDTFTLAGNQLAENKIRLAQRTVDGGLKSFPGSPGLLAQSCEIALRTGRVGRAQKTCTAALAAMDDLPRAHFLLGYIRRHQGALKPAMSSFRRAVELAPEESLYWENLVEAYRAAGRADELDKLAIDLGRTPAIKEQAPQRSKDSESTEPAAQSDLPRLRLPGR